jgi:phosphatidylglycerol:prolipoprotein diacylglycerol transferase
MSEAVLAIPSAAAVAALQFPVIDPIAISIGPFAIRWYALAYIGGLLIGWQYCRWLAARSPAKIEARAIDDYLLWATLGVVLGGRLGYVFFYNAGHYLANPLEIAYVWQGGMSFHGGLIGVAVATLLFARKAGIPLFGLADIVCCAAPIGLFLGRLANFVNGELFGRPTDVPWAVVFPQGGPLPRHPSQLYEAALEGLLLFLVLWILARRGGLARCGLATGLFLAGYGAARLFVELFREPDAQIGFLAGGATMGQALSLPMLLIGIGLAVWALRARSGART